MNLEILDKLIEKFSKFPGVGKRTAERFAFYILELNSQEVSEFVSLIQEIKNKVRNCKICNNLTQDEICSICKDPRRDSTLLCVVEEPRDILAIERTSVYNGKYFVLLGALAPLEGIGINDTKIGELVEYVKNHPEIKEIIISTDADMEGETTANYIFKLLKPLGRRITRIGVGIPLGADLEFVDKNTLEKALKFRKELS
ncbi:MAG: recombination protein RecR [Candidatus Omnitrophica bacterium 4484_49]|nr:MAG: recombination protein RecR [Candidatus Omnitrophica bacterium 4484_49]